MAASAVPRKLRELHDVAPAAPNDGDVVVWNAGTGRFEFTTLATQVELDAAVAAAPILAPATSLRNVIQPSADVVPLTLKGAAGQSQPLLRFQSSTGLDFSWVDKSGNLVLADVDVGGVSERGLFFETPGDHRWGFLSYYSMFNGTRDDVLTWGWNHAQTGGERSLFHTLEANYDTGPNNFMEWHFQYVNGAGEVKRFLACNVNRATHLAEWAFLVDGPGAFAIEGVTNRKTFVFVPGTISTKQVQFRFSGASGEALQIGNDGSPVSPDLISIGPRSFVDYSGLSLRHQDSATKVGIGLDAVNSNAALTIVPWGTTRSALFVRGLAGQSADLQQWQDSAGLARFAIKAPVTGFTDIFFTDNHAARIYWGSNVVGELAGIGHTWKFKAWGATTHKSVTIQALAGQTTELLFLMDSAGAVLSSVSAAGKGYFKSDLEIDGALDHDGTTVGFFGVAPVARPAAYTPTNVVADRAVDANATTIDELADVLGTLISDLQSLGLIG